MVKSQPRLDATFAALADPTRRAIVDRLAKRGDCTVGELAEPFAMSLPAVSKHIGVLERAGLVERHRHGRTQRCRLADTRRLAEAAAWLSDREQVWHNRLDRLAKTLEGR